MVYLIIIVFSLGSFIFIFSSGRFSRQRFENWILSRPRPYVLNVLYFSLVGWVGYSIYKDIRGEEIEFGNFFHETYSMWSLFLFLYLTYLAGKRLEMEKSNRIDYFKNKQEQQKERIEKSM